MSLPRITRAAARHQLDVFGMLHEGEETLLLLGPKEPGFWAHFTASPEYQDAAADPLDRWSKRVIGAVATEFSARAIFPSDGPPYPAFIDWALRSGRAWASPVGMLVHDVAGLMVSFRGALAVAGRLDLPPASVNPCAACLERPCRAACPVAALSPEFYDVSACQTHVQSTAGVPCRETGCLSRRACPVSARYGRLAQQSAFHMKAFLPK